MSRDCICLYCSWFLFCSTYTILQSYKEICIYITTLLLLYCNVKRYTNKLLVVLICLHCWISHGYWFCNAWFCNSSQISMFTSCSYWRSSKCFLFFMVALVPSNASTECPLWLPSMALLKDPESSFAKGHPRDFSACKSCPCHLPFTSHFFLKCCTWVLTQK